MAEFTYAHATRVLCGGSEKEEGLTQNTQNLERRASDWGRIAMLDKTQDFFQTCDSEGKGYITRTDMRRLHTELPLSSEELENVFDSLDSDRNGYLTLGEFSSGFSDFLHGRRLSKVEEPAPTPTQKAPEALYQTQWDEYDDEEHFSMLLESLGASNVFEDPSEVRSLWVQLKRDEPHLLSNFEEFLARVTYQIKEAQQERKEMESALMRKAATHDDEIQHLYEEMELQIKNEKDRLILKDSERLQSRSQDLQQKLSSKEQELDQLFQKQRRLEHQCRDLHDEHQESRVENVKLKMTNEELSRELERTSQKLELAQEQMAILQEQASRLQHEREREMYQVTEGLQREKQSLMKQLDLLREMNKHLRDERDISSLKPQNSIKLAARKKRMTSSSLVWTDRKLSSNSEAGLEDMSQWCNRWSSGLPKGHAHHQAPPVGVGRVEVEDTPPEGWPLRRVISIEEDHLPHLLLGEPVPLFHQLSEEEEEEEEEVEEVREDRGVWEGLADLETGSFHPANVSLAAVQSPLPSSAKATAGRGARIKNDMCSLARGQPVGKETRQRGPVEGAVASPDCLFKVILVGNSSVGKTALLRRFCDGQFHSSTSATVGIDYCVRTLNLGDSHVALQLWDTAGQERYRSITTQYFRKADGVVVIYDVTVADSFRSVRPWLANILDAVGDFIPIMLLGNKCDRESEREVQAKDGQHLAEDAQLMFYECSAYTGCNVLEALMHLARVLRDREDRVREKIHSIILVDQPLKKKACCK